MTPSGKQKRLWAWLGLLLLAAMFLAGCGGEFWGSVGDWEPGELGLASPPSGSVPAALGRGGDSPRQGG